MEQVTEDSDSFLKLKNQVLERVDLSREVSDDEMQELIEIGRASCRERV